MNYYEYLRSDEWKTQRNRTLTFWGYKCAICNGSDNLEVHHRTYERLGQEKLTDLIVLCDACHEKFHKKLPIWHGWLGKISGNIFDMIRG